MQTAAPAAELCSLNHIFDKTITGLSSADAVSLAEVLNQCSRVALPGPGREWGLAVEKRRILAALLRETERNLWILNGPSKKHWIKR